jgi:DNA-binding NtrC family response regulator
MEETYDLLIVDLLIPQLDGSHLLQHLNSPVLKHPLYVMIMTANPHMVTEEMWEQVDFVLYKPIDVKSFVRLISRLADGKKAMEQARLVS